MRITLKFNDFDFRHRKVVDVIRSHGRNMTEFVAAAIMHYISCPNAGEEFSKIFVKNAVKEVIAEMLEEGSLAQLSMPQSADDKERRQETDELGDLMSAFR